MNKLLPPTRSSLYCSFQILLALGFLGLNMLTPLEAYGSKVEQLPGFQGPLPFELETGSVILIIPYFISFSPPVGCSVGSNVVVCSYT